MTVFDLRHDERARVILDWAATSNIPFKMLGRDEAGLDCAGATQLVYAKAGRTIKVQDSYPAGWWRRDPMKIVRWTHSVLGWKQTREVRSFDMLILGFQSIADHTGVYAGGGKFIHMAERLVVSSLSDRIGRKTWAERLFGAYRPEA